MITEPQKVYINEHAYLPEHLVQYVLAISGGEPFLHKDFLFYRTAERIIFVGYSLEGETEEESLQAALAGVSDRFSPVEIALLAPVVPAKFTGEPESFDDYYRLSLEAPVISSKTRNMLRRAQEALSVRRIRAWTEEHEALIDDFLSRRPVTEEVRWIYKRIGLYVSSSPDALVLEARTSRGDLAAFDIADFSARHFVMYMFNFVSRSHYLPGASDLLLAGIIEEARRQGKGQINLGLGINPGVVFFKKKWGGTPFKRYIFSRHRPASNPKWLGFFNFLK